MVMSADDYTSQLLAYLQAWRQYLESYGSAGGAVPQRPPTATLPVTGAPIGVAQPVPAVGGGARGEGQPPLRANQPYEGGTYFAYPPTYGGPPGNAPESGPPPVTAGRSLYSSRLSAPISSAPEYRPRSAFAWVDEPVTATVATPTSTSASLYAASSTTPEPAVRLETSAPRLDGPAVGTFQPVGTYVGQDPGMTTRPPIYWDGSQRVPFPQGIEAIKPRTSSPLGGPFEPGGDFGIPSQMPLQPLATPGVLAGGDALGR